MTCHRLKEKVCILKKKARQVWLFLDRIAIFSDLSYIIGHGTVRALVRIGSFETATLLRLMARNIKEYT